MSDAKEKVVSSLVIRNILFLLAGAMFLLWPQGSSFVASPIFTCVGCACTSVATNATASCYTVAYCVPEDNGQVKAACAVDRSLMVSLVNWLFHSHLGLGGGARVLKPHEQTEVASWLSRTELLDRAPKYNAKKVRVQVGIAYVSFATGDKFTNYGPDWRDNKVEHTNILDADDAAKQACN